MRRTIVLLCAMTAVLLTATSHAAEINLESALPVVVKSVPQAGDAQVDPTTTEITVTFSKPMQDRAWSWVQLSKESFPATTGEPRYLADKKTCVLPVKLEPGRTYALWINSEKFHNFKDGGRRPALPYLLVFRTNDKPSNEARASGAE